MQQDLQLQPAAQHSTAQPAVMLLHSGHMLSLIISLHCKAAAALYWTQHVLPLAAPCHAVQQRLLLL